MSPTRLRIRKRLRALVPQTIQAFASGELAVPDLEQQAEMARAITGSPLSPECLQAAPRQVAQLVKEEGV